MGRRARPQFVAALAFVAVASAAAPAAADDVEVLPLVAGSLLLAGADLGLGNYAVAQSLRGETPHDLPASGAAVLGSAQGLFFAGLTTVFEVAEPGEPAHALLLIPSITTMSLGAHGIAVLNDTDARPQILAPLALSVGANATLSTVALGTALTGRLPSRAMGVSAMVLTAPSVAWGAYEMQRSPTERAAWAGLTAWSGALFLHGFVSALAGPTARTWDDPPPPPPPPPLVVPQAEPVAPTPPPRPPLVVPEARLDVVPGVVGDGEVALPGVYAVGRF